MNVEGLKNILREVDEELTVLIRSKEGEDLFRESVSEFMENTTFDKYHCERMIPGFFYRYNVEYKSPEELKKAFVIEIEVSKDVDHSDKITIYDFEWKFGGCEAYWDLLHNSFASDIRNIHNYEKEEQQEIRKRMKEYENLPLDYIELRFDAEEVFEMYEDDPDSVYDEIEDGDILAVNMLPVLPNGMWLFRQVITMDVISLINGRLQMLYGIQADETETEELLKLDGKISELVALKAAIEAIDR